MEQNKFYEGFDALCNDLVGLFKRLGFSLKKWRKEAEVALKYAHEASHMDTQLFTSELGNLRACIRKGQTGETLLRAIGYICEASRRGIGIMPYVEQVIGAMLMSGNYAIQMQTGEGKTITATLAAIISCWKGSPCHVVTSNDYLAKRDAVDMSNLYRACGLNVSFVVAGMNPPERRLAYDADVVYSTSKELLADYLRDKLLGQTLDSTSSQRKTLMRGLHTAIIDEADSVLADEATVPLIISTASKNKLLKDAVTTALQIAQSLTKGEDYILESFHKDIKITPHGKSKIESFIKTLPAVWSSYERTEYLVKQALVAQSFYQRDVHYVEYEGKIVIVDEKTGRMMPGRSWTSGLHQAVEAKEGVEISDVTESQIQMSFQMYFRLYKHLAGMSGTLQNLHRELWSIYRLVVVKIPTHVPKRLVVQRDMIFKSLDEKWKEAAKDAYEQAQKGRAVLIGTRTIKDSEALYKRLLNDYGIDAAVLNAVRHEQEAEIVAQAGKSQSVTIATNMAGRGTDIKIDLDTLQAGGLHVIATERHESRRIDMQLFGRTARQGQPGTAQMMLSLQDEVFKHYCPLWLMKWVDDFIHTAIGSKIAIALYIYYQRCAEKAKSKLRKRILMQDIAMNKSMSFTRF